MKKLMLITLLSIGCTNLKSSKENKQLAAEKIVTSYLATVLNDPKSYQSVSFDSIETQRQVYWQANKEGIALNNQVGKLLDTASSYRKKAEDGMNAVGSKFNYKKIKL